MQYFVKSSSLLIAKSKELHKIECLKLVEAQIFNGFFRVLKDVFNAKTKDNNNLACLLNNK